MTRVLFLQGAGVRAGAERCLLTLARHLPAAGVDPIVAALADGPFLAELEAHGIPVERLGAAPRARQWWRMGHAVEAVASAARRHDAAVVQAVGEKMGLYGGRAARRAGVRSALWLHDAPARDAAATALQIALAASPRDAAVAPSRWMAQKFRVRLGMRTDVIPHGIDAAELPPRPHDLRAELGWDPGAVVVGHFARLQRWKGGADFLTAAADVGRRHPEARFVVVGGALYGLEPDEPTHLARLAGALGLGDRVRFLGHREDALALMAACDVVVHCSTRPEPFGMVVLEAMALGRAVIASSAGAPPELIDHGRTGLLATPARPVELAAALHRLVSTPRLRRALGTAAQAKVERDWTARVMAERFAHLYDRLLTAAPVTAGADAR